MNFEGDFSSSPIISNHWNIIWRHKKHLSCLGRHFSCFTIIMVCGRLLPCVHICGLLILYSSIFVSLYPNLYICRISLHQSYLFKSQRSYPRLILPVCLDDANHGTFIMTYEISSIDFCSIYVCEYLIVLLNKYLSSAQHLLYNLPILGSFFLLFPCLNAVFGGGISLILY